jgi:hypothetical protein
LLWAGEGWPADVEEAIAAAPDLWPRDLVVVARDFSPGALRILQERDANWVDEAGDVRIVGPSRMFIVRLQGRANRTERAKETRPLTWSPSAEALAEAILSNPNQAIVNTDLAKVTDFSPPQISRTLAQFDKRDWTRKTGDERGRGARRVVKDRDGMLRSWAAHVAGEPRSAIQAHATIKDPFVFLDRSLRPALEDIGFWALSGWAALELEAPYASQVPVLHLYVPRARFDDGRLEAMLRESDLRLVEDGGRVIFWPAEPATLRLRKLSKSRRLPVVSAPRLYADLLALGGRGVDAAEHVRETLFD